MKSNKSSTDRPEVAGNIRLVAHCNRGKQLFEMGRNQVILAVGANVSGSFGTPLESLRKSCALLAEMGVNIYASSSLFRTSAVGKTPQPSYLNAVLIANSSLSSLQLLRVCKRIERMSGRRKLSGPNSPRPVDIDVVSIGSIVIGWADGRLCQSGIADVHMRVRSRSPRSQLVVPHPLMHERRFVLEPLAEIAPHWVHPVLGVNAIQLLARLPRKLDEAKRELDFELAFVRQMRRNF